MLKFCVGWVNSVLVSMGVVSSDSVSVEVVSR